MTVWLQRFINHEFLKLLLYLKRTITTREVVYGSAGGKKCWVMATGEHLGQRRPNSEVSLIVLVNT